MSNAGELSFLWGAGILALEVALIVAVALIVSRLVGSARGKRALWRGVWLAIGLVTALELAGPGELLKVQAPSLSDASIAALDAGPHFEPEIFASPSTPPPMEPVPYAQELGVPGNRPNLWLISVAAIWALGTTFFLLRALFAYVTFAFLLKRGAEPPIGLLQALDAARERAGVRSSVRLLCAPNAAAPLTGGVARPFILLPDNFEMFCNETERQLVLGHELEHIRARDTKWLGLAELLRALLWWNPAVWLAKSKLIQAMEEAADAASVSNPQEAALLADCLVRFGREISNRPARALPALGIGLKSGLATRVQRLLNLSDSGWRAPQNHRAKFYLAAAPLGIAALAAASWILAPANLRQGSLSSHALAEWRAMAEASTIWVTPMEAAEQGVASGRQNIDIRRSYTRNTLSSFSVTGQTTTNWLANLPVAPGTLFSSSSNTMQPAPSDVMPIGRSAEEYAANPSLAQADGVKLLGPPPAEYRADADLQKREGVVLLTAATTAQPVPAQDPASFTYLGALAPVADADPSQPLAMDAPTNEIEQARQKLANLLKIYKEKHPVVVAAKQEIERLEAKARVAPVSSPSGGATIQTTPAMSPELMKRYGLLPTASATNQNAQAAVPYQMSPELMRRYGLTPAAQPTTPPPTRTAEPASPPPPATNVRSASRLQIRSAQMHERLKEVQFPDIEFDGQPLEEIADHLAQDVRKRTKGRAINFIFANPNAELTASLKAAEIRASVRDVSLAELLEILVQVCPVPMTYSVEDYGVIFTPTWKATPEQPASQKLF